MIEDLASGLMEHVNCNMEASEVCVLGETVDMLKDLCEAEYYSKISKAMDESKNEEILEKLMQYGGKRYYDEKYPYMHMYDERMKEYEDGRMHYPRVRGRDGGVMNTANDGGTRVTRYGYSYDEYMEKRKNLSHTDPNQRHERVKLMEEESTEIMDMISDILEDVSAEEKTVLKNKLMKIIQGM